MSRPTWPREAYQFAMVPTMLGILASGFCTYIGPGRVIWGVICVLQCLALYWLGHEAKRAH